MLLSKRALSFIFLLATIFLFSNEWISHKSIDYLRITDCIIEDIDNDNIDEIIISSFSHSGKFIDVYKISKSNMTLIDRIKVPYFTVFFDVGDLDNNGKHDIVFLTSEGLFFRDITYNKNKTNLKLKHIKSIKSEIVVPQPELLTDVNMVIDLNGDGQNELIIENIRSIEIFETKKFTKITSIGLKTVLEYTLIPGQFYPHYIFYTLPIILIKDLNNDNKMEIVTKFPSSINIYSQNSLYNWSLKNKIDVGSDNVYFLSNSYVKFAFPVIADIDNDKNKEIVVSSVNLNLPRLKFEAIGNIYAFNKNKFQLNTKKKIIVKGIPLNLPKFFNISNEKYKDFIIPMVPFNLISIFGLLSGAGNIKVPFLYFKQDGKTIDTKHPKKLFTIPIKIENITSFVEELPLDQLNKGEYPDFYYFIHNKKEKSVNIIQYYHYPKKDEYRNTIVKSLNIPGYNPSLPSTLKLGSFSNKKKTKKDIIFYTHKNLFAIFRK